MVVKNDSLLIANEVAQLKHKSAGSMADKALQHALKLVVAGASVEAICRETDAFIMAQGWGIAFPCCVSVNKFICHFSPLQGDSDILLKSGDIVKVELGTVFEGHPALVASTLIVPGQDSESEKSNNLGQSLLQVAQKTINQAIELIQDGAESNKISLALRKIAEEGGASWVEGMMCHGISLNSVSHGGAGESIGMLTVNPIGDQSRTNPSFKFSAGQVYVIDVALTTATIGGKFNLSDTAKTTVYRVTGQAQSLRLKTSRAVMGEIGKLMRRPGEKPHSSTASNTKVSPNQQIAFHIRQLENAVRARVALHECTSSGVAVAYPVMEVRAAGSPESELANVRLMATILVGAESSELITHPIV